MKKLFFLLALIVSNYANSQLVFTPNNCFFSPQGTLKLFGETIVPDDYNRNKHYERIGNWRVINDTVVWGLKNTQAGSLTIELFAGIATIEDGNIVSIIIDGEQQDLTVHSTSNLQDYQSQGFVEFSITTPGSHEVKIKIKTKTGSTSSNFGEIEKLIVTGSAITDATVWLRRWRPAAIHSKMLSDFDTNTEITVFEMTILSTEFGSYQPMTSEFGYVGSAYDPHKIKGFNFSLWSYSSGVEPPPHYQMSHLVAVGGPGNYFGRYGHEGTGVKPRGFAPWDNIEPNNTYTLALRKKSSKDYNTYWAYYLDPTTNHWKLFGCGKKYNDKGDINYLSPTGTFLEVVGPPNSGRTGHRQRVVEYRGWRKQVDGTWGTIDRLNPAGSGDVSYKEWTQNSSGDKFIMKMGGLLESAPNPGIIQLNNPSALPDYLKGDYVDELYQMPADFSVLTPEYISDTKVKLKYKIDNLGTNAEIALYYGTTYGLTEGIHEEKVIDFNWDNDNNPVVIPISSINDSLLEIELDGLELNADYYYRLRIKNDEGITWAYDTDKFNLYTLDALEDVIDNNQVRVFPNPCRDWLNVKVSDNSMIKEVSIFNILGTVVLQENTFKSQMLNIEHLPQGVYYVLIQSISNEKTLSMIVKN